MIYILNMGNPNDPKDYGVPTRIWLVGPFGSVEEYPECSERVMAWIEANNPHDNPCWQVVDVTPNSSDGVKAAYQIEIVAP